MKELEITITGLSGTGKSTVALMIEDFLKEKGFNVEMNIDNELSDFETEDKFREVMKNNWVDRVDVVKENLTIKIKQIQKTSTLGDKQEYIPLHPVGILTDTDNDECVFCRYDSNCPPGVYLRCLTELKEHEYYLK